MNIQKRLAQQYGLSERDAGVYTDAIDRILKLLIHMGIVINIQGFFSVAYSHKGMNLRQVGSNKKHIRAILTKKTKFYIYSRYSKRTIISKPKTDVVCTLTNPKTLSPNSNPPKLS